MIWLHLIANALLLWLGYYWLGVGESSVPRLLWSVLLALIILCIGLVVHGAAFAGAGERVPAALKTALRHLVPLFIMAVAVMTIYGLLAWWKSYSTDPAFQLASWLTLKLRRPVKPERVQWFFDAVLWVVRWVILPWIVVPLAGAIAKNGWSGIRRSAWVRPLWYWIAVPLLLLAGLYLPLRILLWVPKLSAFGMQVVSLAVRAILAYLLFAGGLLGLARITSGRRVDSEPQPEPPQAVTPA